MIRAETLTPETVVTALGAGLFYGSAGVALEDVASDGDTMTVRIGPPGAAKVRFICDAGGTSAWWPMARSCSMPVAPHGAGNGFCASRSRPPLAHGRGRTLY